MNVREYLELREGRDARVQRLGDGSHLVTCPAHDDRNPSLHVTEGRHGCVLLKCQAGCDSGDVIAADGLDWSDLFPDDGQGNGRVEVATYDYTDERGELLFQCVRFHPKGFKQRRPNGRGGWVWNLQGVRRVLFRLPNVLAAVQVGQTIYVVEGEKDVHALERAGQVATCNPMGAGKWRPEYAESLRDANVIVVADHDAPGQDHARAVACALDGLAASLTIVEPAVGKDAADHLAAGKTVEDFVPVDLHDAARGDGNGEDHLHHGEDRRVSDHDLTVLVIDAVKRYQALEDTDVIRVTLAVAVTSELDDEPLWLQIVGGPSSGKSEAIAMLREIADGRIGEVTVAGLLGWSGTKKRQDDRSARADRRRPQARHDHRFLDRAR